ncbi:MAG: hypothetical protein EKK71_14805 [Candidatus Competibacteraceae bacterium]|nr:MAG: hypothetical protein EKK71_14805 [Candidatus Competibacteraceae bacterium]
MGGLDWQQWQAEQQRRHEQDEWLRCEREAGIQRQQDEQLTLQRQAALQREREIEEQAIRSREAPAAKVPWWQRLGFGSHKGSPGPRQLDTRRRR